MWTIRLPVTGEDELRAEVKAERKARKAAEKQCGKLEKAYDAMAEQWSKDERDLMGEMSNRDKVAAERETELLRMAQERDNRIEDLEVLVRLRERELEGAVGIIQRDRQRIEAETAIEVARAELAAYRSQGEQRGQHAFIP